MTTVGVGGQARRPGSRHGFQASLGPFSSLSVAVIKRIDRGGRKTVRAANYLCCDLACPPGGSCPQCGTLLSCSYCCPSSIGGVSYKLYAWFCSAGTRIIGCGECVPTANHTCEQGPFHCSFAYDDGTCGIPTNTC